jgi:hypothetical protein
MILRFANPLERSRFLNELSTERPDILARLEAAFSLPDLVDSGLTDEQRTWLRDRVPARQIFEDIRFEPMIAAS